MDIIIWEVIADNVKDMSANNLSKTSACNSVGLIHLVYVNLWLYLFITFHYLSKNFISAHVGMILTWCFEVANCVASAQDLIAQMAAQNHLRTVQVNI